MTRSLITMFAAGFALMNFRVAQAQIPPDQNSIASRLPVEYCFIEQKQNEASVVKRKCNNLVTTQFAQMRHILFEGINDNTIRFVYDPRAPKDEAGNTRITNSIITTDGKPLLVDDGRCFLMPFSGPGSHRMNNAQTLGCYTMERLGVNTLLFSGYALVPKAYSLR
jgi:hypothetical protein